MLKKLSRFILSLKEHYFLSTYQEIIYSQVPFLFTGYSKRHETVIKKELDFIKKNTDLSKFKKIVVAGAGAVPWTSIFLNRTLAKRVESIDKNMLAVICGQKAIKNLNLNDVHFIHKKAEFYDDYDDAIVFISLKATSKFEILKRIFNHRNNLVVLRQPKFEFGYIADRIADGQLTNFSSKSSIEKNKLDFATKTSIILKNFNDR